MRVLILFMIVGMCGFAADRPNVLFVIADDWGRNDAGAYGNTWIKTPTFDQLAKDGLLFRNAYTPNAKCAPSRACILTGRNPWQLEEAANHVCYFPVKFRTYAEALTKAGLSVGTTGKGWAPGVAKEADGSARAMAGKPFNKRKHKPPTKHISSNDYAGNFSDFLDGAQSGSPWVFWCGMTEPHRSYEYGSGVRLGGKQISDITRVPSYWPDTEAVRNDMLDYAFEVEWVDQQLARLLAELDKRGMRENTVVIVTSDNGMPFPRVKGNAYDASNHLPFAVRWPAGITKPGRVIDDFISFIDIAPTICDLVDVDGTQHGMSTMTGSSLRPIFSAEQGGQVIPTRDHVLIGRERNDIGRPHDQGYPVRGIVTPKGLLLVNHEPGRWPACNPETGYLDSDGGPTKTAVLELRRTGTDASFWRYCFGKRIETEFYDLTTDLDCVTNVAATRVTEATALRAQLETELRTQGDPRMDGKGAIFDSYRHSHEANVGFYERYMAGEKLRTGWVSPTDFERDSLE